MKIAVIGAGPAGCMLARLLHHKQAANTPENQRIHVTIFEGEKSIDFRSQGGSLDLHVKTGQLAIREAGLWDEFQKNARYDGEAMKVADKNLLCYINMEGSKPDSRNASSRRPEIDRPVLRKILADSLPPDSVRWGKKLQQVDDDLTLHFADGTVETGFDLIVGADGAWSKVRPLVSKVEPFYSGVAGHSFKIHDPENRAPDVFKLVNRGNLFVHSDAQGLFAQYMGDGTISGATWSLRPQDWQKSCGYDVLDGKAAKAAWEREYVGWHPRLLAIPRMADEDVVPRDLYMLPVGHSWTHVKGVTLVGDAAHLMTPFAGEGVNLALEDTVNLANAILSAADSADPIAQLDKNVKDFEEDMFKRATITQQLTFDMLNAMYMTPGAPRSVIEDYVLTAIRDEVGSMMWLVGPLLRLYYWFFKLIHPDGKPGNLRGA